MNQSDYQKFPESVQDYLFYLLSIKQKSKLTVQGYALDIQMFLRYMKIRKKLVPNDADFNSITISDLDIDFLREITLDDAHAFLTYCYLNRGNDAAARARKAVAIKRFFRYLSIDPKKYGFERNPMQELESPKIKRSLPKYLTLEQCLDLLGCVDGNFRERDYCILALFLNCGLRISELVSLNLTDVRRDDTLRVLGKGNKERTVYLNPTCVAAISRYLQVRPADGVQDRNALFISRNNRRISVRAVQNVVQKFLQKAGLDGQGYSAHKLRHTAATLMYQHGDVDVLLLKEILGHENLSTTEIYTHVVDNQVREAMLSNPLGSLSPSDDQEN
ncbi:MAG: tyrosine-type recombinase/integrase [Clostridia bacterium]|nr:tyrosine-type recombinase/integrase [Clostridia bacterium]